MSEVIDPVEQMEPGACKGTYEENNPICKDECYIRAECMRLTKSNPKAVIPPPPPLDSDVDEFADIKPRDYLVNALSGRYETKCKEADGEFLVAARKDGKTVIKVKVVKSGKCLIEVVPTDTKIQLSGLESCRQVHHLFQAVMVV